MKRKWIILIALGVLCITGYLYLHVRKSKDFEPLIKDKLAALVRKASNGLYQLDIKDIDIDITNATITASDVTLHPDSLRVIELEKTGQLGNDIYTISLKNLFIKGLSPLEFLSHTNIDLEQIILDSPEIKVVHKKREHQESDTGNFYSRIVQNGQSLKIGDLQFNNIHLTIHNLDKNNTVSEFQKLSASFTEIQIDSTTRNDSSRFLFAKDALIVMKEYATTTRDKLYTFSIDSISLKPQADSLRAFGIRLKPFGTKEQFSSKLPYMKDRYDLYIKQAYIQKIRWWNLLAGENFYGDVMKIKGGYISVYDDRTLPQGPKTKIGNYPHQLLMKLDFPVAMPKISVSDFTVKYEELNPKSHKAGMVEFDNVQGEIYNVSNVPEMIARIPAMKVITTSRLMNDGVLQAAFTFNLRNATNGDFEVDALLGPMDGKNLNKATEGLGLIRIKDLAIDKLEAHIRGSNLVANGEVAFAYHNLKVDVLKANEDGDVKKRGLVSFVTNTFIIHNESPSKKEERPPLSIVTHNRDSHKSFFNLIWKTLADGVVKTVKTK